MNGAGALLIASGIVSTLGVTAGAFVLGAALGVPICAMRVSRSGVLNYTAATLIVILRSVPPIVWVFLLYFGIGSGLIAMGPMTAAVLALGVITSANMAEIYRGALHSLAAGQWDAATALGLSRRATFLDVVAPQLFRVTLPSATTYAIGLLKDSAIASTIGVHEIAYMANFLAKKQFNAALEIFAFAGLLYILVSLPMALFARFADAKMRARVSQ